MGVTGGNNCHCTAMIKYWYMIGWCVLTSNSAGILN